MAAVQITNIKHYKPESHPKSWVNNQVFKVIGKGVIWVLGGSPILKDKSVLEWTTLLGHMQAETKEDRGFSNNEALPHRAL